MGTWAAISYLSDLLFFQRSLSDPDDTSSTEKYLELAVPCEHILYILPFTHFFLFRFCISEGFCLPSLQNPTDVPELCSFDPVFHHPSVPRIKATNDISTFKYCS